MRARGQSVYLSGFLELYREVIGKCLTRINGHDGAKRMKGRPVLKIRGIIFKLIHCFLCLFSTINLSASDSDTYRKLTSVCVTQSIIVKCINGDLFSP